MSFVRGRLEIIAIAAIAAAVYFQCFVEPIVGSADNRDYWRVAGQLGIAYRSDPEATMFWHLVRKWNLVPPVDIAYLTSQVWIGKLALAINPFLAKRGVFDIRAMGIANAALYVAGLATLLFAFRHRALSTRIFVSGASTLFFTDVRIVAYFNSLLSESAQVIFLIATIGFALLCSDGTRSARIRSAAWLAFVFAAIAFLLAKNQDATYSPSLAIAAYVLVPPALPRPRLAGLVAAFLLATLPAFAMASGAYAATTGMNVVVTIHEGILPVAEDPALVMQELGDPNRVTLFGLARFYAHHPETWAKLVARQSHEMHSYLPHGNFSKPLSGVSEAFDLWSELKKSYYPRSLMFLGLLVLSYSAVLVRAFVRGNSPEARSRAIFELGLLCGNVLQFLVVVSFEANGTAKHFFIFNVLSDVLLALGIVRFIEWLTACLDDRSSLGPRRWRTTLASTPARALHDVVERGAVSVGVGGPAEK